MVEYLSSVIFGRMSKMEIEIVIFIPGHDDDIDVMVRGNHSKG